MARNNGSSDDPDKSVQYPVSMPDSYWTMLDWLIDQQERTDIGRSEMVRICVESFLHRFIIDSDPKNKKTKAFFKEAYLRISEGGM